MFMTVRETSKPWLKLCILLWLLSETVNNVYPSWWPNFHCCIFQANKHIFLNGCLSVRSVSTSTSHYSDQFPFRGSAIRKSKMAADPIPKVQRNISTESTNQQQQFQSLICLRFALKWGSLRKKKACQKITGQTHKASLSWSYSCCMLLP